MYLVGNEVVQFEHVGVAHRHRPLERLAGPAVIELYLSAPGMSGFVEHRLYLGFLRALEHGGRHVDAQRLCGPAEMALKYLPDVHSGRNAERVEYYVHRRAVRQVGHVLHGKYDRDDTLVSVTSGHLVAGLYLALHGDEDLYYLVDSRRQVVALFDCIDSLVVLLFEGAYL